MVGILAGVVVGFPVGPTGAICTAIALRGELPSALAGGVGSAAALGIWGALAGLGVSALGAWVPIHAVRLIGGLLLVVIGIALWVRGPAKQTDTDAVGPVAVMALTFTVVISSPAGLALLAGIMAGPLAEAPWSPWLSGVLVGGGVGLGTLLAFGVMMPVMYKVGERAGDWLVLWILRVLAFGVTMAGLVIIVVTVQGWL